MGGGKVDGVEWRNSSWGEEVREDRYWEVAERRTCRLCGVEEKIWKHV